MAYCEQTENGNSSQDGSLVPNATSADYTLRILGLVAGASRGATAVELSSHLALSKSTIERICSGLVTQGYLARDLADGHYVRGPALRRLALNALNRRELRAKRQRLMELVAEVGESSNLPWTAQVCFTWIAWRRRGLAPDS
jgi:DNA-binding IclR family transcriptional regulator